MKIQYVPPKRQLFAFVETGEYRCARRGDWILDHEARFFQWRLDDEATAAAFIWRRIDWPPVLKESAKEFAAYRAPYDREPEVFLRDEVEARDSQWRAALGMEDA